MNAKPPIIVLTWCDSCGLDDRWATLRHGHYANGYRCNGELRLLTYALDLAS